MSDAAGITLVVDDEEMVRHLVRRMLEPDVCRVLEAENGETALRLIQQDRPAIDVVLTDLAMPGIDGFDLVHVLTEHCPDLPVVCMSGFARNGMSGERLAVPFVPKPFSVEVLREAIAPLLARSRDMRRPSDAAPRRAVERWAATADLVGAANELRRRRQSGSTRG